MARRVRVSNQGDALPYNEWIPTHGVMFHQDGKVSLMTEGATANRGRRRNATAELLGELHGFQYWKLGDEVYRSRPVTESGAYITKQGLPSDVRWESSYAHFLHYIKPQMRNRGQRRNADVDSNKARQQLRKEAPYIAEEDSELWDELVTVAIQRIERREHVGYMSNEQFDELHAYGMSQVRRHGL